MTITGEVLDCVCAYCAKPFRRRASLVKGKPNIFCGRPCQGRFVGRKGGSSRQWLPLDIRFWNRVDKNGPTVRVELGPCWVWMGGTDIGGYGAIKGTKRTSTHRVSWELHYGLIPDGLCVLHHCDNPPCVRPEHLFLGTRKDNAHDMIAKGRNYHGRANLNQPNQ